MRIFCNTEFELVTCRSGNFNPQINKPTADCLHTARKFYSVFSFINNHQDSTISVPYNATFSIWWNWLFFSKRCLLNDVCSVVPSAKSRLSYGFLSGPRHFVNVDNQSVPLLVDNIHRLRHHLVSRTSITANWCHTVTTFTHWQIV